MKNKLNKAVFFDRDGIINKRIVGDYIRKPSQFIFIDGFFDLFSYIKKAGFLAFVVTNQQGIGKGLMTEDELNVLHQYLQRSLKMETGYIFDDIYYAPYLETENHPNRKPSPGMLLEAIEKYNINRAETYMLGDMSSDIKAGKSAGVKTIFVGEKYVNHFDENCTPDFIAKNLKEVLEYFTTH